MNVQETEQAYGMMSQRYPQRWREHTRHLLPMITSILGAPACVVGFLLVGRNAASTALLYIGPILLIVSLYSFFASRVGRWSIRTVVPLIVSALAAATIFTAMNIAYVREDNSDNYGVILSIGLVVTAASIGVACALGLMPLLQRSGLSKIWAFVVSFGSGCLSVPILLSLFFTPVGAAAVGGTIIWLTIRSARRGKNTSLFGSVRPKTVTA